MTGPKKIPVGVLGATGMVGQRFVALLENHPWFEVVVVAASSQSAGKSYEQAVNDRWKMATPIPASVKHLTVRSATDDVAEIAATVGCVFSAVDMDKGAIRTLEEAYAEAGVPVVSNNSAHRWTDDVPMIMPEINPHHLDMIPIQRRRRGWDKGLIVVKPNCSIQSYVPVIEALKEFRPAQVIVTTLQAVSGAGKTLGTWPEMVDNVIPFIGGEEEKSEQEPRKIWATIEQDQFFLADRPHISATCIRVPVSDGHMASLTVSFATKPDRDDLVEALRNFKNPIQELKLPSAPTKFLTYYDEDDRPQTRLDRELGQGMGVSVGRLREDPILGWKCVALSHNTIRGAAGGAILVAELLKAQGYLGDQ